MVGTRFLMSRFCGMRKTSREWRGIFPSPGIHPGAAGEAMGMGTGLQAAGHCCSKDSVSVFLSLALCHFWHKIGVPYICGEWTTLALTVVLLRAVVRAHPPTYWQKGPSQPSLGHERVSEIWGQGCQAQQPEWAQVHKHGLWQCFLTPQSTVTGFVCGSLKCYAKVWLP